MLRFNQSVFTTKKLRIEIMKIGVYKKPNETTAWIFSENQKGSISTI